jgi:enterochelin esterase-like enzyme
MIRRPRPLRGRIDRFVLDSRVLRGNPLGDPHRRDVIVYLPPEYDSDPGRRFPVFMDIVGFLGSGAAHLNWKPFDESVPLRLERLVASGTMGPVIAVFPDCWTRLGGNQYINSKGVGNYADHLVREVLPEMDRRYRTFGAPERRAVFGKSSGGYGAIVHGMRYARHWGAVACHSGDMYFEFCYGHDIPRVLDQLAKHGRSPARFLREFYKSKKLGNDEAHTVMFLAMAAFYDPDPDSLLGFHLPMDLTTGEMNPRRWANWRRHDPIHIVNGKAAQRQLASLRGVYIDCGSRDQYFLHYGARILHHRLREIGVPHRYEEFDDDHSSIDYRMDVSLPWLYRRIMRGGKKR